MSIPLDACQVLDREYLGVRARLLEIAAVLDRIDRAAGSVDEDPRLGEIHDAIRVLLRHESDRAEEIQLNFSLAFDDEWQDKFFPAGN